MQFYVFLHQRKYSRSLNSQSDILKLSLTVGRQPTNNLKDVVDNHQIIAFKIFDSTHDLRNQIRLITHFHVKNEAVEKFAVRHKKA